MPKTFPATFEERPDEDAQEHPIDAFAPGRDGPEYARGEDELPRCGLRIPCLDRDGNLVGRVLLGTPPADRPRPPLGAEPAMRARAGHIAERVAVASGSLSALAWSGSEDPEPEDSMRHREHEHPADMNASASRNPPAASLAPGRATAKGLSGSASPAAPAAHTHPAASCSEEQRRRVPDGLCELPRAPRDRRPAGDMADNGLCHASRAFAASAQFPRLPDARRTCEASRLKCLFTLLATGLVLGGGSDPNNLWRLRIRALLLQALPAQRLNRFRPGAVIPTCSGFRKWTNRPVAARLRAKLVTKAPMPRLLRIETLRSSKHHSRFMRAPPSGQDSGKILHAHGYVYE